jgi:hypothetical protein
MGTMFPRCWKFPQRLRSLSWEGAPVRRISATTLKKVALIYCNTMLVASATTQTQEIVCEDINDFIKYDRHYSRLVDETMLDVQTKQYGTVTVVSSIHVS